MTSWRAWFASLSPTQQAIAVLTSAALTGMSFGGAATLAASGFVGLPERVDRLEREVREVRRTQEFQVCRAIAQEEGLSLDRCLLPGEKAEYLNPREGQ